MGCRLLWLGVVTCALWAWVGPTDACGQEMQGAAAVWVGADDHRSPMPDFLRSLKQEAAAATVRDLGGREGFSEPMSLPSTIALPEGYVFSWEVVQHHFEGELAGMITVRLYLDMVHPSDFLSSISGDVSNPLLIQSTVSPSWWNHPIQGKVLADGCPSSGPAWTQGGIEPDSVLLHPDLAFDTWVTLGKDNAFGPWCTGLTAGFFDDFLTLGTQSGSDLEVFDLVGAAWYTPFPGPSFAGVHPAFAGDSLRVLVGQFTTSGQISGQAQVQVFGEANFNLEYVGLLAIPPSPTPCTDNADGDDLCDDVDPCIGVVDACGVCNGPGAVFACGCEEIPAGTCDCEGSLPDVTGNCGGDCPADLDEDGVCDSEDACVGSLDVCGVCNGPGAIYACGCTELPACACDCSGAQPDALGVCGGGCAVDADNDGICDDVDDCVGMIDACGECNGLGAIYACGCSDIPWGDCDCLGHQLDAVGVCGGDCQSDVNGDGWCDDWGVPGCMYASALNFNPEATFDDGTCTFSPPVTCVENTGVYDVDLDGLVGITDFLQFLSVFGLHDYDGDGIWSDEDLCTDVTACNYQAVPTEPCATLDALWQCGGGCLGDSDGDGICDDQDDCDGVVDVCGVCNGVGALSSTMESITLLYDSVYAEAIDTWYVFEVGADTVWTYDCPPLPPPCNQPVGYQGYDYDVVLIGFQCWFAENLRAQHYTNGDPILADLSASAWSTAAEGASAVYGEGTTNCSENVPDGDACDDAYSLDAFGRLYNWYAVGDARGVCPSGWHVPTEQDMQYLELALGMSEDELGLTGWRGTDEGEQLKSEQGWMSNGNGSNSSGFGGRAGGARLFFNGQFTNAGASGYLWTADESGSSYGYFRRVSSNEDRIYRGAMFKRTGHSVRCIQDPQ
ncbi:MAG: fibrobacter succinogenes major paralogous domain-containing protein [Bacteroidetes bacterium]|nr:fibrobacter succinogenes major paralogous domain-containing protein [Bacteroidota bacterium]